MWFLMVSILITFMWLHYNIKEKHLQNIISKYYKIYKINLLSLSLSLSLCLSLSLSLSEFASTVLGGCIAQNVKD